VQTFGRAAAIALLLCIPVSFFSLYGAFHQPGIAVARSGSRLVVASVRDPLVRAAGVRPGDVVDLDGLSAGDRARLLSAPLFRPFSVTVVSKGHRIDVPIRDIPQPLSPNGILFQWVTQTLAVCGLTLGAIIPWRRPGAIGLTFAGFVLNFLYGLPTSQLFGFLPEPAYSVAVVAISTIVGIGPQIALVAFALRFPGPLEGRQGLVVTRAFDIVLIALAVLGAWRTAVVPTLPDLSDPWLDVAPSIFLTAALVAIVMVRYVRSRGDDRRRLAWVAVGSVASAIATAMLDFQIVGSISLTTWSSTLLSAASAALPLAFAYAILRHHVLDLGFAINRTVVYSTITATLLVAVGAVDWLSGKVLGSTHLSAFVEAAVTIAFGVALSWFHARVARGVDRVLFRRRYLAAKRFESRIAALGFAKTSTAVDEALVGEVLDILHIGSAAVFRRADEATFVRTAAAGWESSARELSADHLLLRTLCAEERPVILADAGIRDNAFPKGKTSPDIAIPIIVRHEFLGFALYGHRGDDAVLDPEEHKMLVRLVAAAASAYDAIDAAEWRRRAIALHRYPLPDRRGVQGSQIQGFP
jgi:hypothetical protein